MSENRVTQNTPTVKLNSGEVLEVPKDADPAVFQKYAQGLEDLRNAPPKKTRRTRAHRTRKTFRASQVLTASALSQQNARIEATADLVERVNNDESDTKAILVSCGRQFEVLEVAR